MRRQKFSDSVVAEVHRARERIFDRCEGSNAKLHALAQDILRTWNGPVVKLPGAALPKRRIKPGRRSSAKRSAGKRRLVLA